MRDVRGITFACFVACIASSIGGCYAAHERVADGGPVDARPVDARPEDARPVDARSDDARVPGGACDGPFREWTPNEVRLEGGPWGSGMARLRDRERTSLAVHSLADGLVHVLDFDESGAAPQVTRDLALTSARGVPLAGAVDGDRIAIAFDDGGPSMRVDVFDPDGRPLFSMTLMQPPNRSSAVIRGSRVGIAVNAGRGFTAALLVIDASGGGIVGGADVDGTDDVSIGQGRGLFNALVTRSGGETHLFGVDERGVIDAASIGVRLVATSWDGTAAVGVDDEGALVVRRAASAIDRYAPPAPVGAPSLAMRGREAWLAGAAGPASVVFALDGEFERRLVAGARVVRAVVAHASDRHLGAFVLSDEDDLRWIGWSCE